MIDFIPLLYFSCTAKKKKIRERKNRERAFQADAAKKHHAAPELCAGWTGKISTHLFQVVVNVIFSDLYIYETLTLNLDILGAILKSVFAAHSGALFTQQTDSIALCLHHLMYNTPFCPFFFWSQGQSRLSSMSEDKGEGWQEIALRLRSITKGATASL